MSLPVWPSPNLVNYPEIKDNTRSTSANWGANLCCCEMFMTVNETKARCDMGGKEE